MLTGVMSANDNFDVWSDYGHQAWAIPVLKSSGFERAGEGNADAGGNGGDFN